MRRGLPALLLAALPLLPASLPAAADSTTLPPAATGAPVPLPGPGALEQVLPLFDAIDRLPVAAERLARGTCFLPRGPSGRGAGLCAAVRWSGC